MYKNSIFLPLAMVTAIVFSIGYVMLTERTNLPSISGDRNYPHQICTFNRYCVGSECSDEPLAVIAYTYHENGQARLEIPGMATQATVADRNGGVVFTSTGGDLKGALTIYRNRTLDFTATEGESPSVIEHFASGSCDRPFTP